jgi:hypothetical protein
MDLLEEARDKAVAIPARALTERGMAEIQRANHISQIVLVVLREVLALHPS